MKRKFIALAFLLFTCNILAAPKQQLFEFIEFPGAESTTTRGINKAGAVVGSYYAGAGEKGYIRSAAGAFTTIEVAGALATSPWGVDDSRVVGTFFDGFPSPETIEVHGFVYENGQVTTLDYPGAVMTQAYGVSASGVVGIIQGGSPFGYHGFLYSNSQWTQLDVPGAAQTFAWGIAPNGQVVGGWNDAATGARRGFIYTGGSYAVHDFPRPGTYATELYAINGVGSILGAVSNGGCNFEPFVFSRLGKYMMLDLPGAFITGLNDSGYVVGIFGVGNKGFIAKASSFILK